MGWTQQNEYLQIHNKTRNSSSSRGDFGIPRQALEIKTQFNSVVSGDRKRDAKDVPRLITLYLCASLFFSKSGLTLAWVFTTFVKDLKIINAYAWSEAIKDNLASTMQKKYETPDKMNGCVT